MYPCIVGDYAQLLAQANKHALAAEEKLKRERQAWHVERENLKLYMQRKGKIHRELQTHLEKCKSVILAKGLDLPASAALNEVGKLSLRHFGASDLSLNRSFKSSAHNNCVNKGEPMQEDA